MTELPTTKEQMEQFKLLVHLISLVDTMTLSYRYKNVINIHKKYFDITKNLQLNKQYQSVTTQVKTIFDVYKTTV